MSKAYPYFQDRIRLLAIGLSLAFLMGACGRFPATSQPSESILSEINAAVTATLSAQETASAQEISYSLPTATLFSTATPTSHVMPNAIAASAAPSASYSSYYTNYGCDDSEFIKDVTISDGTVLSPGETFTKTWKFRNTGSCTWTSDYSIVFVDGDDMDGSDTEIDQTVYMDKKAEISVELTAPDEEGTYAGYWQMADEYGNTFGETVYVEIVVEETATSTPTASPTPAYTSTPTYAYTATPTATLHSTATFTPAPTNTLPPTSTPISTPPPISVEPSAATPAEIPTELPASSPTAVSTEVTP